MESCCFVSIPNRSSGVRLLGKAVSNEARCANLEAPDRTRNPDK